MNQKIAKQNLLDINRISRSLGLAFFLDGGTCLGAVRTEDFIPWDWDTDMGVKGELFSINHLIEFSKKGFKIFFGCGVFLNPVRPFVTGYTLKRNGVNTGIRFYFPVGDKRIGYRQSAKSMSNVHKAEWFTGMKEIDFLGDKFYVPTPPEEYLERVFGSNWRTPLEKGKFKYTCLERVENYIINAHQIYMFRSEGHTNMCLQRAVNIMG